MQKYKKLIIIIVAAVALVSLGYYIYKGTRSNPDIDTTPYTLPALTKDYANKKYKFTLRMPEDFTANESSIDGRDTIVFQDAKAQGIQVTISPYEDVTTLSVDEIKAGVPDMKITNAQPVQIGPANMGVAFRSDNAAFSGASREVWFVFNGNLYQVSTYLRLENLLQAMFKTWNFETK